MNVRLEQVTLDKRNENGETVHVLKDISMEIAENEIISLIGPSGAGKSTLLRTMNRLEEITSGRIFMNEQLLDEWRPQILRQQVGMVLQTPSLFDCPVWENISYGLKLQGKSEEEQRSKARELLDVVGLGDELYDRHAFSLSVGQQQRVSIARTLANEPEVLLLDEITSALDPYSTKVIEELILELRLSSKRTIIMVTHSMESASRLSDRIAFLVDGELIELAESAAFFSQPQSPEAQQFLAIFSVRRESSSISI